MLLFSTLLEIESTLTKEKFIELVLEWCQSSPHPGNVIPGIVWHGEKTVHFGDDTLWVDIQEYAARNIIAVRYEKIEDDGVIWDTDYIMNFTQMKMAIRLERSYLEEALTISAKFSTPHFITMLIERGYVKRDNGLAVDNDPLIITEDNLRLVADVINGTAQYHLPIVFVSKTRHDEDPVNVHMLARRLKGVAHVLVQANTATNQALRSMTDEKNEYLGGIGIYFPNAEMHRRYLYRVESGYDYVLENKVVRSVIQYANAHRVESLYSWHGINNALLRDRLKKQTEERNALEAKHRSTLYELIAMQGEMEQQKEEVRQQAIEEAKAEADQILESFDEDMVAAQNEIERLSHEVDRLQQENTGLKIKLDAMSDTPVLHMGEEPDFYPGEITDLLLTALTEYLNTCKPQTRRYDVIRDIIEANDFKKISETRSKAVKACLSRDEGMTPKVRSTLEEAGFEITKDGGHYKAKYYGDDRYMVVIAATPSDGRAGKNTASSAVSKAF
ncbi:MAG: hypothetical protein Q4B73_09960 [Lachnospiraceae bacterium]|nr:hypothetical protein [Lachnospiraceae bacterium]